MNRLTRQLSMLAVIFPSVLIANPPTAGAATNQVQGPANYNAGQCPNPPVGYEAFTDYDGLLLEGSLEGCLYTDVETTKETPSGVFIETGEEVFIGSLEGGPVGTFTTTYRFEGKFDASGAEIHGRCQHPIVEGSGTDGFEGAKGRLNFKDIIEDPITYVYRGHIRLNSPQHQNPVNQPSADGATGGQSQLAAAVSRGRAASGPTASC